MVGHRSLIEIVLSQRVDKSGCIPHASCCCAAVLCCGVAAKGMPGFQGSRGVLRFVFVSVVCRCTASATQGETDCSLWRACRLLHLLFFNLLGEGEGVL